MENILGIENISRHFILGDQVVKAVDNISLSIKKGTLCLFMGRSGSGKTTLMNLLSTLDTPTEGKIAFEDRIITSFSEPEKDNFRQKDIGFVYQSIALVSLMTAAENIDFALRISGFSLQKREKRIDECLNLVGLFKRKHHLPDELSGGEQQRVAIARSIAHKPKIIFADEPTGQLDTHLGLQIVMVFKSLIEKEGITVIMATHDPNMVEVADTIFYLEDGKIVKRE